MNLTVLDPLLLEEEVVFEFAFRHYDANGQSTAQ